MTAAMTVRMNWREDAACRDADPDLFFPISATGAARRQMEEAKQIWLPGAMAVSDAAPHQRYQGS